MGRTVDIQCAWGVGVDRDTPHMRSFKGYIVNEWFAVRAACKEDLFKGWAVIHRPTGFAALVGVASLAEANDCATQLTALYGKKWNFSDYRKAKGMRKAKAYMRQFRADQHA